MLVGPFVASCCSRAQGVNGRDIRTVIRIRRLNEDCLYCMHACFPDLPVAYLRRSLRGVGSLLGWCFVSVRVSVGKRPSGTGGAKKVLRGAVLFYSGRRSVL